MKVTVTQEDIDKGCRMLTLDCPVAKAVTRAAGMPASVHWNKIFLLDSDKALEDRETDWQSHILKEWDTPPEVAEMIQRFDEGYRIDPFEFEL